MKSTSRLHAPIAGAGLHQLHLVTNVPFTGQVDVIRQDLRESIVLGLLRFCNPASETFPSLVIKNHPLLRRYQSSPPKRAKHGLFFAFLAVIAVSVMSTILVVWYTRSELPIAQQRAKESEALLAQPSQSFCRRVSDPI